MADTPTVPDPISRRALAAIVFTDIVGFSARMSTNETATLKACQRDLGIMHQICKDGKGQVLKSTGDGLLMFFPSAVDAVRCALKIQQRITEDAKALPPGAALQHRIGIHVGDVFFSKHDVMGDGVNIAARLQEQAEPGGIVISNTVYDLVKGRVELNATYLGPRDLKNIKDQVPIYRLLMSVAEGEELVPPPAHKPAPGKGAATSTSAAAVASTSAKPSSRKGLVVGVLLLLAVGIAAAVVVPPLLKQRGSSAGKDAGGSTGGPPSVEEIANVRRSFAEKYDYRGMLNWMKERGVTNAEIVDRFTKLAMLRDGFDKALAPTSREKPLGAQLKARNMQSLEVWREADGRFGVRRVKVEAIVALEAMPKMDMFTILFSLGKPSEDADPVDKEYRDALIQFADEHQLSSPAISRLRFWDPSKDKRDGAKEPKVK